MVFSELRDLCETWYHMLVSKMLYQRPTVKSVDLHFYAQVSFAEPEDSIWRSSVL